MRTVPVGLASDITQEVTTLCHIWQITREDGTIYRYTSLDSNVPYDGNVYKANKGGSQSAFQFVVTMAVNNLEILGFFDTSEIAENDLIAGKFDNAEVQFSIVNYLAPSNGQVKTIRGWLGEVTRSSIGYNAEVRSLSQALQQTVGSLVSQGCRSQFGNTEVGCNKGCFYPIDPPVWQASHAYALDDNVAQVHVKPSVENGYQYRLSTAGTSAATEPTWDTTIGGTTSDGSAVWTTVAAVQRTAVIDSVTNRTTFAGSGILGALPIISTGSGSGAILRAAPNGSHTWDGGSASANGTVYIDDGGIGYTNPTITANYTDPVTNTPTALVATNVALSDLGSITDVSFPTTTEGHKPLASSVTFTIVDNSASGASAGFFNGGSLLFTSGDNSGLEIDIKDFTDGGGGLWTVTLYRPVPFLPLATDTVTFKQGCDHTLVTCFEVFDNVVNFRGEPSVPGTDVLFKINTNL